MNDAFIKRYIYNEICPFYSILLTYLGDSILSIFVYECVQYVVKCALKANLKHLIVLLTNFSRSYFWFQECLWMG